MVKTQDGREPGPKAELIPTLLQSALEESRRCLDAFCADPNTISLLTRAAAALAQPLEAGGKLLACGNGGSMAQAMHLAEELSGRFRADRRPLPAIACTDPGHITCTANDYGYEAIFTRWVEAMGRPGDALVCLSTSGQSPNLIAAARTARSRGMTIVGLLGKDGGELAGLCDHPLIVPGHTADRIQEVHTVVMHTLIESIEHLLDLA